MGNPSLPRLQSLRLCALEYAICALDRAALRLGRAARTPQHLALGAKGEEAAFFYLRRQGYIITARGWRSHRYAGDIDLIGWAGNAICFVEVKTRTSRDIATAESAVDEHKRRTLRKIAGHYMRQLPERAPARFDVLSIYFEKQKPAEFILFRGAFGWTD